MVLQLLRPDAVRRQTRNRGVGTAAEGEEERRDRNRVGAAEAALSPLNILD
jgi:hypothetical protein